jgi:outer membrane protein OmpA-like peptidoglycan-associated protein
MPTTILLTPFMLTLTLLASCGSPPKPPSVDESSKRPVNSATAVELQVCKHELQNTRLLATEATRLADSTAATLASISARQQALLSLQAADGPAPQAKPEQANAIYTVRFAYGSSRVEIPADAAQLLVTEAKSAPLVMLRGRTDGQTDTLAERRIARDRANAVRDYLVAAGVDAARIRATHQPTGDPVADNGSSSGQALNRRVEVEIYRVAPVALGANR